MFRWKKRDEGFEWQKYVRTTIKLRREARKRKAQELGSHLAEGARAAGAAAEELAKGSARQLGSASRFGIAQFGKLMISGVSYAGLALGAVAKGAAGIGAPALDVLGRPGVSGPLTFIGLIALFAGAARVALAARGLDAEALVAFAIGAMALVLGLGPSLWLGHGAMPRRLLTPVAGLPGRPWLVAASLGLVALVGAIGLKLSPWRVDLPLTSALTTFSIAGTTPVAGKATAMTGDTLRIGDTAVQLAGMEVLDPDQRCTRAGSRNPPRTWACGQEAREALQRLVQGQAISCEVGSKDGSGRATGRCKAGGADLAEALVRAGHAFAAAGLVSAYRTAEDAARSSKAGLWASAEPERPAAWRDRMWTVAKRQAPDGCPIKGRVRGDDRIYLLPWSSEYDRVRISKSRGERWFCSEDEAQAAGWRNARKS